MISLVKNALASLELFWPSLKGLNSTWAPGEVLSYILSRILENFRLEANSRTTRAHCVTKEKNVFKNDACSTNSSSDFKQQKEFVLY